MIRQAQYKDFSLKFHKKGWQAKKPNVCQFELTFGCPLHCQHCFSDCYNHPEYIKKELSTKQVIKTLDKVYSSGTFWLCFTGGDPLARRDFLEIYAYAKKKGFIITIFTSAVLITEKIADYFKRLPPFCIELTLNGITPKTYEAISGVKGSFKKAISGIKRLRERNIPFKIKTQATKQNIQELDRIKDFVESLDLKFRPGSLLQARLNGDLTPCRLRLKPKEVLGIDQRFKTNSLDEEEFGNGLRVMGSVSRIPYPKLFRCAAGSDTFHIDPYGNMFLCTAVRKPSVNLLRNEIAEGFKLFGEIKAQEFKGNSKCKTCSIWYFCHRCPGRAYLETGDCEMPIDYFCELAHLFTEREKSYEYNQA